MSCPEIGLHKNIPAPSEYLEGTHITEHLGKFSNGGSYLVPKDILDTYGRNLLGMPDNSQFIMSKSEMDDLLRTSNKDIALIEKELGIPSGSWQGKQMVRIDIPNPSLLNLRMPNGNEMGANSQWIPGGLLPTGRSEAVINQIPIGQYIEIPL